MTYPSLPVEKLTITLGLCESFYNVCRNTSITLLDYLLRIDHLYLICAPYLNNLDNV